MRGGDRDGVQHLLIVVTGAPVVGRCCFPQMGHLLGFSISHMPYPGDVMQRMWKKLWFRIGLGYALGDLGIPSNTVNPQLRQAVVALAMREGFNRREAALIIYFRTPPMRLLETQRAQKTIAAWQVSQAVRQGYFARAVRQEFALPEGSGVRESLFQDS